MTALDLVGPYHFLASMWGAQVDLVTTGPDLCPVPSDLGLALQPTVAFKTCPGGWGTIIAHQSFSLHFLHAHVRGSDADAGRHARAFVRLLQALKPGRSFVYAPGLPFFEASLMQPPWTVERQDLPVPHGEGPAFRRTRIWRREVL